MQVTTIEEARALVGRTFERDGKRRTVILNENLWMSGLRVGVVLGDVLVQDDASRVHDIWWFPNFNDWISGANEITDAS